MGVDDFDDEAFLISIYISRFDRKEMNCTVSEASVDRVRERLSNFQLMSCGGPSQMARVVERVWSIIQNKKIWERETVSIVRRTASCRHSPTAFPSISLHFAQKKKKESEEEEDEQSKK